jgi:hypothetical protein
MLSFTDMLLLNDRDRHTNSECNVHSSTNEFTLPYRQPQNPRCFHMLKVFVLLHVNNKTSSSDGANFSVLYMYSYDCYLQTVLLLSLDLHSSIHSRKPIPSGGPISSQYEVEGIPSSASEL